MPTSEQVKQIKRSFRLYMNGVAAASMRRKGLDYQINWGIQLPDLKRMASQYGQDAELARALWAESGVRECRLLATLIMPPGQLDCDEAVRWATTSQLTSEIMEMAVFNLFQHAECADSLALQMLRQPDASVRTGRTVGEATIDALLEAARADILTADRQLLHALVSCLQYMASTDHTHAKTAATILNDAGFDAF